ncbi:MULTISPECIES: hypothetical protein [Klebsiella pneumoniae complex]|nr:MULTISPECIES: hypothetical protein [Klebsiella]HBQ2920723.1 hypothetical protein [Klebsiella quasipneumoniae subsp. similipneumoniae]MBE3228033.1 hypothetical protein [Klebsiella pneumoniae]MBW5619059.1 hypothetical protein [Klebsiella pneumoniae]MCB3184262.1 hypothetical protein [Klebsiella pneumoniae]MCF1865585.1 hypothetical protein [Klebsiella pneumoniae]
MDDYSEIKWGRTTPYLIDVYSADFEKKALFVYTYEYPAPPATVGLSAF